MPALKATAASYRTGSFPTTTSVSLSPTMFSRSFRSASVSTACPDVAQANHFACLHSSLLDPRFLTSLLPKAVPRFAVARFAFPSPAASSTLQSFLSQRALSSAARSAIEDVRPAYYASSPLLILVFGLTDRVPFFLSTHTLHLRASPFRRPVPPS